MGLRDKITLSSGRFVLGNKYGFIVLHLVSYIPSLSIYIYQLSFIWYLNKGSYLLIIYYGRDTEITAPIFWQICSNFCLLLHHRFAYSCIHMSIQNVIPELSQVTIFKMLLLCSSNGCSLTQNCISAVTAQRNPSSEIKLSTSHMRNELPIFCFHFWFPSFE